MNRRSLIFLCGIVLALGAALPIVSAQNTDPTVEAAVQALFTASAQPAPPITQTVEAAFQQALQATAQAMNSITPPFTVTPNTQPEVQIASATPFATFTSTATSEIVGADFLLDIRSEVVPVTGGTFRMGTNAAEIADAVADCIDVRGGLCTLAMGEDSAPQHEVTLNPYNIELTEVTYEQYVAFLNVLGPNTHVNGCDGQPCIATRSESENATLTFENGTYDVPDVVVQLPVGGVTWFGARAYCAAIGRRLPTEAEWEHAARGGTNFIYPWGLEFDANLARTRFPRDVEPGAVPVGSFPAGASVYGVLDMAGNVAEWVSDWYSPVFYSQTQAVGLNPSGPPSGTDKVLRGGSWDAEPFFARSVHRQFLSPIESQLWVGFRCVEDVTLPTQTPVLLVSPAPSFTPTPAANG